MKYKVKFTEYAEAYSYLSHPKINEDGDGYGTWTREYADIFHLTDARFHLIMSRTLFEYQPTCRFGISL